MTCESFLCDKFTAPALPGICVPRPKLTTLFEAESDKRVIFVTAPAGYGKTVSTQLWLAHSGRKYVWINLDSYDNTSAIFYKLACAGILSLQQGNTSMEEIYKSAYFASSPVEHTIRLISELMPDDHQYALVLDDAHCLTNKELIKSGLLTQKRLPFSFVLLILSRNKPSDDYLSAVGEGKYAVIGENELAFSQDEIRSYFRAHGHSITSQEAREVFSITGGWAIGIKSMALIGKIEPSFEHERIWDVYFKNQIWDHWSGELREFMLKTAIADSMPVELCQKLTGRKDSRQVLEKLFGDNTFVCRLSENEYYYHNLFLEFLRSQIPAAGFDTEPLHKLAAEYYMDRGKYFIARRHAAQSGDLNTLLRIFHELSSYGIVSLDDFIDSSKLYAPPSESVCDQAPFFYSTLMWESYLLGNAAEMELYMDKVYQMFPMLEAQFPESMETVMMRISLDHRFSLDAVSERFASSPLDGHGKSGLHGTVLTHEMPFLHRSNRDYYELTDKGILDRTRTAFRPLLKEHGELIFTAIESGLLLEQNSPREALEIALSAEKMLDDQTKAELRFSVYTHLMAAYYALRNPKYLDIIIETESFIERNGAYNLRPNLLALKAKLQFLDGDRRAAEEFLEFYFVTDEEQLALYKIYQHFATARAYIVLGQTRKALRYIEKLRQLGRDFRRPFDLAEAGTLQAVVEWVCGMRKEAQETLETVLLEMQPYRFIRVVAIEGAAVLPILKRLASRIKGGHYHSRLEPEYLNSVIIAAYEQSKKHKGIAAHINVKPPKLSARQKTVLALLSHGCSYDEIAEEMALTIHTVKSHVSAAYSKLDVHNSMDAVIKARTLGLMDSSS